MLELLVSRNAASWAGDFFTLSATRWTVLSISDCLMSIFSAFAAWNFECFVDEVSEHLLTQPLSLFRRDLTAVSDRQQGKALLDVGLSDDVAVHNRRRLDDGRDSVAEDLRILRQLQRLAGVDLSLLIYRLSRPRHGTTGTSAMMAPPINARLIHSSVGATSDFPWARCLPLLQVR
jgi:hypothetical protein